MATYDIACHVRALTRSGPAAKMRLRAGYHEPPPAAIRRHDNGTDRHFLTLHPRSPTSPWLTAS